MPVYLVPAMVRVEADTVDEANELAGDFAMSNLSAVGLYLDEALPTVEVKEDAGQEFPHSMMDEAVYQDIFTPGV
jgi:hypothetical protein